MAKWPVRKKQVSWTEAIIHSDENEMVGCWIVLGDDDRAVLTTLPHCCECVCVCSSHSSTRIMGKIIPPFPLPLRELCVQPNIVVLSLSSPDKLRHCIAVCFSASAKNASMKEAYMLGVTGQKPFVLSCVLLNPPKLHRIKSPQPVKL